MPIDHCKSCKAPIRWVHTANGKRMPLNADPVPDGNITIRDGIAHTGQPELFDDKERFTSHFVTCPFAAQHRKAK